LVQAFLKKWWVESDLKAPNLPLSLRLKGSVRRWVSIVIFNINVYVNVNQSHDNMYRLRWKKNKNVWSWTKQY
jgi:hypothetical protein